MVNFYDPPHGSNPTSPNGSGSIESRLTQLEVHCWHETQSRMVGERHAADERLWLRGRLESVHRELEEMQSDRMALIIRIGMWVVGGLCAALWAIVFTAWSGVTLGHG